MKAREEFWNKLTLDRTIGLTLSSQLVDAVRMAVDEGVLKSGDILPSQLKLAARLGTSARVPREAFAELAAEGIALARPRIGCVILPQRANRRRGRILFVIRSEMSICYYTTVLENALRTHLVRDGFTFVKVVLKSRIGSRGEYTELDNALLHSATAAIAFDDEEETLRRLRTQGIPVIEIGLRIRGGIAGVFPVRFDVAGALPDLLAHCRKAGVRTVDQFSLGTAINAVPALRDAGIVSNGFSLDPVRAKTPQEGIQRAALAAINDRYGRNEQPIPDVIVFTDDYLAVGGLLALALLGVRIPEDVRVVVFSNVGNGPVHAVGLTRMEMDPRADARCVINWLRAVLSGKSPPANATLRPRYIRDGSFR